MISKTIGYNGVHNIFRHTHMEVSYVEVPQNGWFIMEKSESKMDDLDWFGGTSILGNLHMVTGFQPRIQGGAGF